MACLWLPAFLMAQTIVTNPAPCLVTNLYSGPRSERINIVVLGDGYASNHLDTFEADVSNMVVNVLFKIEPYASYRSYFNVFSIRTASLEEGADIPSSNLYHDTYFNCTYGWNGIDRLLTVSNAAPIVDLLAQWLPDYNTVIMLVNDTRYGGSGGNRVTGGLAVTSKHNAYEYVVRHEMGHSLGDLKDEYDDATPGYVPFEAVNCTAETNRNLIKWRVWIKNATPVPTPEVASHDAVAGLFEGCMYTSSGWYRPHYDSLMNGSSRNVGQINIDQLIKKFYNRTPDHIESFQSYSPADTNLTVNGVTPLRFFVSPMLPSLGALSVQWYLDGAALPGCVESNLLLSSFDLGDGNHVVSNVVSDPTLMVRIYTNSSFPANPLTKSAAWNVTVANQPASNSPGELEFAAGSYSINKAQGAITVSVVRSLSATSAVSVAYATADGSAVAGINYLDRDGTLSFPDGVFTNRIIVPILNNAAVESNKTFTVSLSNPAGGAWLGPCSNTTVTIMDFNSPVVLTQNFNSSVYLPDGWSSEFVEGTIAWNVHTNYGRSSSHCARLYSDYYCDHKTKLITPPLDFGSRTNNAVLSFLLWMDSVEGLFVDELRIFYKTGTTNAWTLAAEYTYTNVYIWTAHSLALPDVGGNYYLAFEANSKDGLGLRLDDISITASNSLINADTNAPSQPANLILAACSSNSFSISWNASTDNGGVVVYYLFRNAAYAGYTTNCSYNYAGLAADTVCSNWVVARDLAGNTSPPSAMLVITTLHDVAENAPGITANPQSLSVTAGASAVFSVSATGSSPLCHFWMKNAVLVSDSGRVGGSRTSFLTISPVEPADAGNYSVLVTNMAGVTTSAVAVLTINDSPALTVPASPAEIAASDGTYSNKVKISWSVASTAVGYTIWRNAADDSAAAMNIGSASGADFDDTDTAPGVTNYYWVKATNAAGSSGFSSSDMGWRAAAAIAPATYLDPPTHVSASDGAYTDKVAVTWNTVSGASAYQVWRAPKNNVGAAVNLGNATMPSHDDNSSAVRAATMYYYWVKAWNSVATSEFSKVDSGFCRLSDSVQIISGQPIVGDYDGDNRADPAVYDLTSGRLFVWLSSEEYFLVAPVATFQVSVGDLPVTGDFDGDGLADPGVFNRATGSWYVWLSSASYYRAGPVLCGQDANDIPVPADYDGDRKTDPAIYQASDGGWHVWLSSAGYIKVGPFPFRQSFADIPAPGQFDIDHLADPAVYQQTSGAWYIWASSAGYVPVGPVILTTADDHLPVPADYDGDGLCDPAAYVPAMGKWRLWMSSANYALTEIELK